MRAPCVFIKSGCKRTLEHPTCVPRADTAYVRTMHDSASDDKKHSGKAVPFLMPPRRSRGGSRRCRLCPATAVGPATQREPARRRRAALRRSPLHRQPHRRLPLVALVPCDACNLALSESPRRRAERRVAAPLPELRAQPPVARQRLDALRGRVRPSFAYSLFVHSLHACRDRVVLLPACSLYGAATLRPPPLGPDRGLTLPRGWNNAGT